MRTIGTCLVAGAVLFLSGCGGEEKSPAEKALSRMADFYGGIESFEVHAAKTTTPDATSDRPPLEMEIDYLVQRPNRFRVVVDMSAMLPEIPGPFEFVSDGERLSISDPGGGRPQIETAPADLAAIDDGVLAGDLALMLMTDDLESILNVGPDNIRHLGEETVGDVPTDHLQIEQVSEEPGTEIRTVLDLWIAQGDTPFLAKSKVDRTAHVMGQENRLTSVDLYSDWKFDVTPAEGVFAIDDGSLRGRPAPDFDVARLDGGRFALADHRGESIVVLDFWATWCGYCVMALPNLTKVAEKYEDQGVVFCAMNRGERPATIQSFLTRSQLSLPLVGLDQDGEVSSRYGVEGIPHLVLIGKDGTIQAIHIGYDPAIETTLSREIDALLSGENLVEPKTRSTDH